MRTWKWTPEQWRERSGRGPVAVRGPWDDEPDKGQWVDEATGLDCLIVRGPMVALCGYVGAPPGHPWHGKDYNECVIGCGAEWCEHTPEGLVGVHGGLTFSGGCDERAAEGVGICHVPEPGRPADVWWFGFDCAHAFDLAPAMIDVLGPRSFLARDEVYRTWDYVAEQCAHLAEQLAAAAR